MNGFSHDSNKQASTAGNVRIMTYRNVISKLNHITYGLNLVIATAVKIFQINMAIKN